MATVHFDYTNPNIQGLIDGMFFNRNANNNLVHTSTIKHQTVDNVNLDLFVDSLHDKLARIFCEDGIRRHAGGSCPKTVEEDDLFDLQSKNPPANNPTETVIEHFINSVVTKTVIPLFNNINQMELRIKDIFKFFFLLCFSNLLDPADTSGENFIRHLRKKTNNNSITLPFEAGINGGIFTMLSQHTYSMCGDKLLYAYILHLYPTLANPANPGNPGAAWAHDNVRARHLVILNFVWQCTLTYIQSISHTNARFGTPAPNQNFPTQGEIVIALDILRQIQFVGFYLQSPDYDRNDRINDYRYYTYANATFIFRNEQPQTPAQPFAVSQGIAAECINELYPDANAALPREGSPHRYKVQCKIKLQRYINNYTNAAGQTLTQYQKSVIYVLLKFAGDTSHLVNYMIIKNALQQLPQHNLKANIFCCERALIARCIQENHSFYCRDVKVLAEKVPLALGDCYYFNVDPLEEYRIKNNLLQSFHASAGGLQGVINAAITRLTAIINAGPPIDQQAAQAAVQVADPLVKFINFYKAYMLFNAFINTSRNKYTEFVETIIPSQFRAQTRVGRIRSILNISTPLSSLFESLRKKKTFEKASFISAAYYSPLVSILSELNDDDIRNKARDMGLIGDIRDTLQIIRTRFISRINMLAINGVGNDDDIRSMLSPDNNHNDNKMTELIINIIKCQKNIDIKLSRILITLNSGQNGGSSRPPGIPPHLTGPTGPTGGPPTPPFPHGPSRGPPGIHTGGPPSGFGSSSDIIKPSSDPFFGFSGAPTKAPAGAAGAEEPDDGVTTDPDEYDTNDEMNEMDDGYNVGRVGMVGFVNTRNIDVEYIDELVNRYIRYITHARGEYSYIHLAEVIINNLNDYSDLYRLFNINRQVVGRGLTNFVNTTPAPVELYGGLPEIDFNVLLLLQYFSSMVDHQVNLNILEEAENETIQKLIDPANIDTIIRDINQLRDLTGRIPEFRSYQDLFISIRNNQEIINYLMSDEYENYTEERVNNRNLISKRPYFVPPARAKRRGGIQGINFDIDAYIYLIKQSIKQKRIDDLKDALIKLYTKEGIDRLNILLEYSKHYKIDKNSLKFISQRELLLIKNQLEKLGYNKDKGLTSLNGGKNIRSVSKMYRKNNKKVKNVKKTRKIKKNNDKKQKTSKKMTKTSVQKKKSIKNKSIKNMKNKKDNKSKTKKGKKN